MDRPGGYVRVIKTGFRQGDGAETALIELVDFNENFVAAKETKAAPAKKTRRSRAKSYTAPVAPVAPVVEEKADETPETEEQA